MFKKIIAVLLAVLMITGLVGCGGEKPKDENKGNDKPKTSDTTDAPVETDEPEPTVDPHDVGEKLAEFNPTGTVEETVLFDNEISKITLKSLEYTDYEAIFNLSIENKTDGELDYSCGSVGYCVNSVNGYMVSEGFIGTLKQSLVQGKISMETLNTACRLILEAKYKLGLFDNPYKYCDLKRPTRDIFTKAHRKAARRIAAESFVLLKN